MQEYQVLFSGASGETIMSSRYIITFFPSKSPNRLAISQMKVARAIVRPKGITKD